MSSTPEGKVKEKIGQILRICGAYYHMPIGTGYGSSTLDYLGVSYGRGFAIEAKAPGKKPTKRQYAIAESIERAGGKVFILDGAPDGLRELATWLRQIPNRMD